MFQFGDQVKDIVTGYTGIVTARYGYANGCVRYEVVSQKLIESTGLPVEGMTVDEQQLKLVKARKVVFPNIQPHQAKATAGGPRNPPSRQMAPKIPTVRRG